MSVEQAKAFFEKVQNDEDLQKKLSEAQDSESKLEIARQEGFEFDLQEANKAKEELTDNQIANVAGGALQLGFGCWPVDLGCYRSQR